MNILSLKMLLPGKCCTLQALLYYKKVFTESCNIYWKKTPFGQFLLFIFISTTLTCKSLEHSHLKSWPETLEGSAVSDVPELCSE